MKPNTRIYPFLEGRDISRWTNPDLRYSGVAGNSLSTIGSAITTDDAGNASGLILIPNFLTHSKELITSSDSS